MRRAFSPVSCLALLALPTLAQAQQYATVTGSVSGATSRRGVDAALVTLDNGRSVRSNSRGEFVIKELPPGSYTMRVFRIGYRPKVLSLPVSAEDARHQIFVDVSLEPLPVELKPVVIKGDTNTIVAYGRLADFYRHRRSAFHGWFITRSDIERRQPFRVTDMLITMPGVWYTYGMFGDRVFAFQSAQWSPSRGSCGPAVFLDGARTPPWVSIDELVNPDEVEGIEVYRGDLAIPLEYWGGCGAVAIWTR